MSNQSSYKHNLKVRLMERVYTELERRGMRQRQAATLLDVSQARISNLKNQKTELFSIDMLLDFLSRLGIKYNLVVDL